MNFHNAIQHVQSLCQVGPTPCEVEFVTPIVSATLASLSASLARPIRDRINFSEKAQSYADHCGLTAALSGQYSFPIRSGLQGSTYTKLTRLATHAEVDRCNEIVNDLIFEQLLHFGTVAARIASVIGELHDNVASHAKGLGFSCAQTYNFDDGRRLEFAIVDSGCGMLRNVQTINPTESSHAQAIEWCLKRGNTTARSSYDPWAQRLPEDAVVSPFPMQTSVRHSEDHHIGEGLWKLAELVRGLDGKLWVASGDGQMLVQSGHEKCGLSRINWTGVAIEVELTIAADNRPTAAQREGIERVARRVGI